MAILVSLRAIRRRMAATYVAGFFLVAAATPHHHLNPIEDLFSDDRSDSGVFALGSNATRPDVGPSLEPLRFLDDDPCLACFQHDFVSTAAAALLVCSPGGSLAQIDVAACAAVAELRARSASSRSPPASV